MKTINEIMYFVNDLFFVGYLEEDEYRNVDYVRNKLVNEFQDLD